MRLQKEYEEEHKNLTLRELEDRCFIMEMADFIENWNLYRAYRELISQKSQIATFQCIWCGSIKPLNKQEKGTEICKECYEDAMECQRCNTKIKEGKYCEDCYAELYG